MMVRQTLTHTQHNNDDDNSTLIKLNDYDYNTADELDTSDRPESKTKEKFRDKSQTFYS